MEAGVKPPKGEVEAGVKPPKGEVEAGVKPVVGKVELGVKPVVDKVEAGVKVVVGEVATSVKLLSLIACLLVLRVLWLLTVVFSIWMISFHCGSLGHTYLRVKFLQFHCFSCFSMMMHWRELCSVLLPMQNQRKTLKDNMFTKKTAQQRRANGIHRCPNSFRNSTMFVTTEKHGAHGKLS